MGQGLSPTRLPSTSDTGQVVTCASNQLATNWVYDDPLQLPMLISTPGCHLYFWPTGYISEVPKTCSSISINLLEQFTELRETFYLLDYWFIIKQLLKDTNQQPEEEIQRARHGEGVWSFHAVSRYITLPISPHVHQCRSSLNPVLLGFYEGFITLAWLIKSLAFGDWFNLQPLSPPWRSGEWD